MSHFSNFSTCITYDVATSLIILTFKGTASAQDVINFYDVARLYANTYGSKKLLIDVRGLTHDFPATDLLTIMPILSRWLSPFYIARVVGFNGFMHDLFLQKAQRCKIRAENFETQYSAKRWLENQPSI